MYILKCSRTFKIFVGKLFTGSLDDINDNKNVKELEKVHRIVTVRVIAAHFTKLVV